VARGTRTLAEAMATAGTHRLVVVSAAPVAAVAAPGRPAPGPDPGDDPLTRYLLAPILRRALRRPYADLAEMEAELQGSSLDWTVVRPPRLTDGPLTGHYRTALGRNLPHGRAISRADVAHALLDVLHRPETVRATVGIAY
jgi:NAD(P)H-binding